MAKLLTTREKIIAAATLGVIAFSLFFNFFVSPFLQKSDRLDKEISVVSAKLQRYMSLTAQKEKIMAQFKQYTQYAPSPDIQRRHSTLFDSLSEIETLSNAAGVRIVDIRPQPEKRTEGYAELIIEVRTEASLASYVTFIYSLENSLSLLRVMRVQINSQANSPLLEGSFTIAKLLISP